jgi:hypothetical protein
VLLSSLIMTNSSEQNSDFFRYSAILDSAGGNVDNFTDDQYAQIGTSRQELRSKYGAMLFTGIMNLNSDSNAILPTKDVANLIAHNRSTLERRSA